MRREVVTQRAQGAARLDHRIEPAVQPSGHLPRDGGVALLDLVGLDEGDVACRCGREPGEGLHDRALGLVAAGDGERAVGTEPHARDFGADLAPAPAGPQRHVELLALAPAAHPDQAEVAHRGAGRSGRGLEVLDLPTGPHELQRMPRAQDATAGDDGPAVGAHWMSAASAASAAASASASTAARMASAASQGRSWPKTALPATKTFAPALDATGAVSTSIPPSTSTSTARERASTARRTCSTLPMTSRDEALAAEAGEHGHAQHEVDIVQIRLHGVERRVGVEGEPGPQPELAHLRDELRGAADLDVHGAAVGARVGEGLEIAPGLGHHEVAVEEERRVASQ